MSLLDALLLDGVRTNIWVAVRTDGNKGGGTQNDPYNASTADLLDAILDALPPYTAIHFGPGEFETRGFKIASNGTITAAWQLQRGWKLIGSGIDVTTLKLIDADTTDAHYYAIGHDFEDADMDVALADHAEVSDLTINCNVAGATGAACGAVRIKGNSSRVRRIKVKDWGTKSATKACHVIASITSDTSHATVESVDQSGIEECIAVEPYDSSTPPVTVFYSGAIPGDNTVKEAFGRAPYLRNCYVDPGEINDDMDIRALAMNSCALGIVEGNEIHNCRIGGPFGDEFSIRSIAVRWNAYRNVANGPLWDLGSLSASESVTQLSRDGTEGTFTASADLNLIAGDRIKVTGGGGTFDGIFEITGVTGLVYTYSDDRSSAGPTTGSVFKLYGIDRAIVEGNTIDLRESTTGSFDVAGVLVTDPDGLSQPPPYSCLGIDVRSNHIRNVDGLLGLSYEGVAVKLKGVENLHVRDNIVSLDPTNPILHERVGSAYYFNNRQPDNVLVQGYNDDLDKHHDELETEAEDALVLALFNKR